MRDPDRNFIELRGRKLGVIEGVTRYVPWACGVDPSPSSMHQVLLPCARVFADVLRDFRRVLEVRQIFLINGSADRYSLRRSELEDDRPFRGAVLVPCHLEAGRDFGNRSSSTGSTSKTVASFAMISSPG